MNSSPQCHPPTLPLHSLHNFLNFPDDIAINYCASSQLRTETDHELRAALICLLTEALADKGTASIIGETQGGWFWLPPWSLWEPWAMKGLESVEQKMAPTVARVLDRPLPLQTLLASSKTIGKPFGK
jgi:hypothetical protein